MKSFLVDQDGYYGEFGGAYIPEILHKCVEELTNKYLEVIESEEFKKEFEQLLRDYVDVLPHSIWQNAFPKSMDCKLYLKREDLNQYRCTQNQQHHRTNLAGTPHGKETHHRRNRSRTTWSSNSYRMCVDGYGMYRLYGKDGCRTPTYQCGENENAGSYRYSRYFRKHDLERRNQRSDPRLVLPSCRHLLYYRLYRRPHPYPDMVARLQSVISEEIKKQLQEKEGRDYPDYLIACVGGGSNAAGTIYHYINDERVGIILAEAGGKGIETGMTAATIQLGKMGIIHGARTYVIQNEDGQIEEPYSISAGLDYPGIGPIHANLAAQRRANALAINDDEAIEAAYELTKLEGIIPALESAHALGALRKLKFKPEDIVVLTVSGRGDKDIETYLSFNEQQ